MKLIEGNNDNFESLIENKNILVVFSASWCGPCSMLYEEINGISEEVDIIKIDVDDNHSLCKKYGVMSVPTLIYFKADGTFDKKNGFMAKDAILKWISD